MAIPTLTLGCVEFFDRTLPILKRQVSITGFQLNPTPLKPTELLTRFSEFDVCEIPLFAYLALRALEDDRYIALPIFPHRGYPHGSAAIHEKSGIKHPRDLVGHRIGTPGLFLSGTVWMRGILEDDFGVSGERAIWVTSPTQSDLISRISEHIVGRSGIPVETVSPGQSLSAMLETGEIDAWVGPLPPDCLERGAPGVRRLFEDYREVERSYASRAKFIPALHTVVMRRQIHEENPGLATRLVELFDRGRAIGFKNFQNDNVFACMLPWTRHHLDELKSIFGADWVPNGYGKNREMIATALNYAERQGLMRTRSISDLFKW